MYVKFLEDIDKKFQSIDDDIDEITSAIKSIKFDLQNSVKGLDINQCREKLEGVEVEMGLIKAEYDFSNGFIRSIIDIVRALPG